MAVPNLPWWTKIPLYSIKKTYSGYCDDMGWKVGLSNAYWIGDLAGRSRRTLKSQDSSYVAGINTGGWGPVPISGKINGKYACSGNVIPMIKSYRATDSRWTATRNLVWVGDNVTGAEIESMLGIPRTDVYWDMTDTHFNWKFDVDHDLSVGWLKFDFNTGATSYRWAVQSTYKAGGRQRNIVFDSTTWWPNGYLTRTTSRQALIPAIWGGDGGSQGISAITCKIRPA